MKLRKQTMKERDALLSKLAGVATALEREQDCFNDAVGDALVRLRDAVDNYNEVIDALNEWRADAQAELQDHFDDKSERWQESERGQAFQDWINVFDSEPDIIELEAPDTIELEWLDEDWFTEMYPDEID